MWSGIERKRLVDIVLQGVLALIFIYAGATKIFDPVGMAQVIHGYDVLPGFLVNLAAIILPWVEVLAGLGILLRFRTVSWLGFLVGLSAVFVGTISWNLHLGKSFDCGCFGTGADPASWWTVLRDSFLLSLLVWQTAREWKTG